MDMVADHRPRILVWNLVLELDGAPLPLDSSIRDFQKGKASYDADANLYFCLRTWPT